MFNVSRRYIVLRFQYKGYFIKSLILVSYYDKEVINNEFNKRSEKNHLAAAEESAI